MLALEAQGVQKRFGAVVALSDGRLELAEGEIRALIGANGCGKSTLSKIITGTVAADAGTVCVAGRETMIDGPRDAEAAGIGLFYQELSLIPQLSIEDNLFLGREPRHLGGFVDRRRLRRDTRALIELFADVAGEGFAPTTLVSALSPDQRQLVEILKVFARRPRIMILDEATAALDRRQVEVFFAILRRMKGEGISSVLITHRMDEVFAICDRITVMRNGVTVADLDRADSDHETVVRHMVGEVRERIEQVQQRAPQALNTPVRLAARNLGGPRLHDVSFALHEGEILGLGGLRGQGQSQLLQGLFGIEPLHSGRITLNGVPVTLRRPSDAIHREFGYISGDRGRDAALHGRSILENLMAATLVRERRWLVSPRALRSRMQTSADSLHTRLSDLDAPIGTLSGGNQQKILIARWLVLNPRVLLLDDPTKGIDLSAKADLYALMRALADAGASILFYSSEDAELLGNCDRVLVFNSGHITRELRDETLDTFHLYEAAFGGTA